MSNSILKIFINQILRETSEKVFDDGKKSAGIVVIRKFNDEWKVLCLKKPDGTYDITKGLVEDGEGALEAAIRETEEESGLSRKDLNFTLGFRSVSYGKGTAYVAITETDPVITPNPITGEVEHISYDWFSFDEAERLVKTYLRQAISWAKDQIKDI